MKMSRRKVRETIFLLLFRVEFNTQEELQEQIKWYFEERPDIEGKDQIYMPFCVLQFMRLQMMRIFLRELPLMKP